MDWNTGYLQACKAEGTLIIPVWKSAVFRTIVCEDGVHWNIWVHDRRFVSNKANLITRNNRATPRPRERFENANICISPTF